MIYLGSFGLVALTVCSAALIAGIAFTLYSFKNAVLVDDYDNPIEESINTEA